MATKYTQEVLLPALKVFVKARTEALAGGFTDNGGAIHSIERIVDMLASKTKYPFVSHINNLKKHHLAERSVNANLAIKNGQPVSLEHVMPQRAYAQGIAAMISKGEPDEKIMKYIKRTYRLVLLTRDETNTLNRINRSAIAKNRLASAGIKLFKPTKKVKPR